MQLKGKGLLYLIGIAVLISIVFIACKNKPTGMNDFVPEAPEVEGVAKPTPETGTSITPPNPTGANKTVQEWAKCGSLEELYNNGYTYYKSTTREGNFEYILEITAPDKVEFKGNNSSMSYNDIFASGNKNYISRSYADAKLRFGSENKVDEKWIEFKPHNMPNYIKFCLTKKS